MYVDFVNVPSIGVVVTPVELTESAEIMGQVDENTTIKTARRVFEVLDYFEEVQRSASLKEIAARLRYPVSSAAALLKSLVALGYLIYDPYGRTYMPTMRIAEMGRWLADGLFGETAILDLVNFVHSETGEHVNISMRSDLYARYIYCVQSIYALHYELRAGQTRPLALSGVGRAILSAHTDEEIAQLVMRINSRSRPDEKVNLADLMIIINGIRRDGYMFSKHVITQDAGVIAIPLPRQKTGRVLVLGVGGPVTRLERDFEKLLAAMKSGIARFL